MESAIHRIWPEGSANRNELQTGAGHHRNGGPTPEITQMGTVEQSTAPIMSPSSPRTEHDAVVLYIRDGSEQISALGHDHMQSADDPPRVDQVFQHVQA
jgi:hypothetical protein